MNKESHMETEHNLYPNLLNLYGIAAPQEYNYDLNQRTLTISYFLEIQAFFFQC